jgi:transcriptional regulator with XRE-family HTH domain/tetratricopeptide (TPR) repeat protein
MARKKMARREQFAEVRRTAGYTQEQLAEALGIDRGTPSRWETGVASPLPYLRPQIAELLNVSREQLNALLRPQEPGQSERSGEAEAEPAPAAPVSATPSPVADPDQPHGHPAAPLQPAPTPGGVDGVVPPPITINGRSVLVAVDVGVLAVVGLGALLGERGDLGSAWSARDDEASGLGVPSMNGVPDFPVTPDGLATLPGANLARLGVTTSSATAQGNEADDHLDRWCRLMDALRRRGLLRLLGVSTASALVPQLLQLNPDEQARLLAAFATPRRVDAGVIAHSEAIVLNAVASDRKLGPQSALHTVVAQYQLLKAAAGDCPDALQPRLLAMISNAARVAGWLFFNVDDFTSASHYHAQARAAAHQARDQQLAAFTLADMSHVDQWAGNRDSAVEHAVAAHTWLERTDNAPLKASVSDVLACAYAALGEYDTAMRQLAYTEALLPACHEQVVSVVSNAVAPFCTYSPALHISRRGRCLLKLGRTGEAIEHLERSLTLFAPQADHQQDLVPAQTSDALNAGNRVATNDAVRGIAVGKIELGQAYILSRDIDQAAAILGGVANLVAQNRTNRLTKKLRTTRSSLQPWQDTRAVKELDEKLEECGLGTEA